MFVVQIVVKVNAIVENLFDDRIEYNSLRAKAESAEVLEKREAEAKKARAYGESIQDVVVNAKELAKTSLAMAEAKKKRFEESLACLHKMYTKLEATSKQIKEASQSNFNNC